MQLDIDRFAETPTPFYYYDLDLLRRTLDHIRESIAGHPYHVHYAMKANSNPAILRAIAEAGMGADCVSGGELRAAVEAGFDPKDISYAGVGKTDNEIRLGIGLGIGAFNVESVEELEIIAETARQLGTPANVCLRINPDIDAHTHHYITTGIAENKFGIDMSLLDRAISITKSYPDLNFVGLHFHIGSQITSTDPLVLLCERIAVIAARVEAAGLDIKMLNVGGGLGIDYDNPEINPIPDFAAYFKVFKKHLHLRPGQRLVCEPGRSIVAQCGTLVTRAIYIKNGISRKFVIVDGGMSDLIRPALYQAHHAIRNLSAMKRGETATETYDVVGPICETADTFATDEVLPLSRRGDIIVFLSAGAYGESMSSKYNMRALPAKIFG